MNEPAQSYEDRLAAERALADAERADVRHRRRSLVTHKDALAGLREDAAMGRRARKERHRDAREATTLAELYRSASVSGARARTAALIQGSAEVRALRIARVRQVSLGAGVPVLLAFAAWSTTGVHAGVTDLLHLSPGAPGWWAAWAVEPALIAIVALIILGRAWLRSAGGDVDRRATVAEWSALTVSVLLNLAGAWPGEFGFDAVAAMVAHSIGPIGAAATAFLIGAFDDYVFLADPWTDAPTLEKLGIQRPDTPQRPGPDDTPRGGKPAPEEEPEVPVSAEVREHEQAVDAVSQLGTYRSMDQLKDELRAALDSGELSKLTADAITTALSVRKTRARELRDWARDQGLTVTERTA